MGNCQGFHESWVRSQVLESNQKPDIDPYVPIRKYQTQISCSKPLSAAVAAIHHHRRRDFRLERKSLIVLGLISLLKSTAIATGVSSTLAAMGISPFKASSIMPFLQVSKWLPNNWKVDKGGTLCMDEVAEASQLGGWVRVAYEIMEGVYRLQRRERRVVRVQKKEKREGVRVAEERMEGDGA
ncbi:hypothetical protein TB2_009785 [Malus domestica]|uniref:Uncharacterized protein n=1 Tax=Malus domestica TaxID=3750 RepID=A0A498IIP9_MALDO|nr:hypothetical protein DVH24_036258 [Malus domestica]